MGNFAMRRAFALSLMVTALLCGDNGFAQDGTSAATVNVVSSTALPNVPGNSITALTVDLPPGDVSPPHHHAGFVFVYVLAGSVESQLNADPPHTFKVGDTWVEPPGTLHTRIVNPSKSDAARILAVFVAPTGAQLTTPN
jgi:quercetin dioxygenase-like cupin family protein